MGLEMNVKQSNLICTAIVVILVAGGCVSEKAEQQAKERKEQAASDSATAADQAKTLDSLLYESRVNFTVGQFDTAEKLARQVVELAPNDTRHHMLLANICLISGNIDQAVKSFDEIIRLEPKLQPHLWQRGLALYYADEFKKGKEQFETHQNVNSTDVENAVWHLLCAARLTDVETAREAMIPIEGDKRIPMKEIYEVFAGRMEPEKVIEAAAESKNIQKALYYGFLYNGLYYEMIGEKEKSIKAMENAQKAKSPMENDNLMNQVATIHLRLRNPKPEKSPTK